VRQAYEFALNRVGQDKESGEIWSDYIQFLRAGEVCHGKLQIVPLLMLPATDKLYLGGTTKNGRSA
jgi:hypothetical protein